MNMTDPWGSLFEPLEELPWPKLEIPKYQEVGRENGNRWQLKELEGLPVVRGYFNGLQSMRFKNWVLTKDDELWMSLTPMEMESAMPHVAAAHGHVVVMGFGMGMVVYNLLKKPEVKSVTVVEKDMSVVELINQAAHLYQWPNAVQKLTIEYGDALEWKTKHPIDVMLVDIWPNLGDERLREDMQIINQNTRPKAIAGWGMELDYVDWMSAQGYERGAEDLESYREYAAELDLPLIETGNPDYPRLAVKAAQNVIMY